MVVDRKKTERGDYISSNIGRYWTIWDLFLCDKVHTHQHQKHADIGQFCIQEFKKYRKDILEEEISIFFLPTKLNKKVTAFKIKGNTV